MNPSANEVRRRPMAMGKPSRCSTSGLRHTHATFSCNVSRPVGGGIFIASVAPKRHPSPVGAASSRKITLLRRSKSPRGAMAITITHLRRGRDSCNVSHARPPSTLNHQLPNHQPSPKSPRNLPDALALRAGALRPHEWSATHSCHVFHASPPSTINHQLSTINLPQPSPTA